MGQARHPGQTCSPALYNLTYQRSFVLSHRLSQTNPLSLEEPYLSQPFHTGNWSKHLYTM